MNVYSIILCGGVGSRLWPESTADTPKPFIDLLGDRSLFQRTVTRMAKVSPGRPPIIVTGRAYVGHVRRQLRAIRSEGFIIAEPEGRDSGPALLAAAMWVARRDPDGLTVVVASDHHIPDEIAFAKAVSDAAEAARRGEIVTFGVKPGLPSSSYGYIRPASALEVGSPLSRVGKFVEKPDYTRAQALVDEGCLWNTGNFMFSARSLLAEAAVHAPEMFAAVEAAVAAAEERKDVCELGAAFSAAPKTSIDIAVMEKTSRAAVLPIDYAWSDLGSWDSVWTYSALDGSGNAVKGSVVVQDSERCLVRAAPGVRVVAIGLRDIAVVATEGAVLVSDLARVADLKPALQLLPSSAAASDANLRDTVEESLARSAARLRDWLWRDALPLWWCFGADHEHGGFHENLGCRDLRPIAAARRARVQARQIHVYAAAGVSGWPGPWSTAVDRGLDYLISRYRRPDGLFCASVAIDGSVVDESAPLYDQAFVLLALATSARARPDRAQELGELAAAIAGSIRSTYGLAGGGFRADDTSTVFLNNPIMHLFEAVLAWSEVTSARLWRDWADELAGFFLDRMWDSNSGAIVEVFDEHWRPVGGLEGRTVWPGHQFEWAWLIDRWRPTIAYRASVAALYESGSRGVHRRSGLALDAVTIDGEVLEATSRLWPQTEWLKAALIQARAAPAVLADARKAVAAIDAYLATSVAGLWTDRPGPIEPGSNEPALASSFYHIVGAIDALAGWAGLHPDLSTAPTGEAV